VRLLHYSLGYLVIVELSHYVRAGNRAERKTNNNFLHVVSGFGFVFHVSIIRRNFDFMRQCRGIDVFKCLQLSRLNDIMTKWKLKEYCWASISD